jgi:hypothetical protein
MLGSTKRGTRLPPFSLVDLAPAQPVGTVELGYLLTQDLLEAFEPFELTASLGQIDEELPDEGGDRSIPFRRLHARAPVNLVVYSNCDIFHSYTVSQVEAEFKINGSYR